MIDILGRDIKIHHGQLLFYIYEDGSRQEGIKLNGLK